MIGSTVNLGNALLVKASRVGSDTALSQIVRLVETAQLKKAPIQAYADSVSSVFVPIVVSLALITFLVWFSAGMLGYIPPNWVPEGHGCFLFALLFGIAVLVIACPCALGTYYCPCETHSQFPMPEPSISTQLHSQLTRGRDCAYDYVYNSLFAQPRTVVCQLRNDSCVDRLGNPHSCDGRDWSGGVPWGTDQGDCPCIVHAFVQPCITRISTRDCGLV